MDDQVAKRSREYLESGYWCAESVLLAVAEAKGVQSDLIPKIATGFCSGMARTGGQCGALSGGILSIGLLLGRSTPGGPVNAVYGLQKYHAENMREHCLAFTEATSRMVMALLDDADLG
jgi:C_GCAxxG_C_C family probable redox protein